MNISEALDKIVELGDELVDGMEYVAPDKLGLDSRSAFRLYVSEEAIAVTHTHDRTLQYYGGFEYVDKEHRHEIGDFVFYLAESNRVQRHIDRFYGVEETETEDME